MSGQGTDAIVRQLNEEGRYGHAAKLENLRIEVARWANERRGIRQSDLLAIYEARIFKALDALGQWREKP